MSLFLVIYLLFAHWIADFVFQDERWALAKKNSFVSLLKHTLMYSFILTIMMGFFLTFSQSALFWVISFVAHTVIDYFTSKWVGQKFERKELGSSIPNFGAFTIIGLDQFIHYLILLLSLGLFYI